MTVNSKVENPLDFCLDFVREFGFSIRPRGGTHRSRTHCPRDGKIGIAKRKKRSGNFGQGHIFMASCPAKFN